MVECLDGITVFELGSVHGGKKYEVIGSFPEVTLIEVMLEPANVVIELFDSVVVCELGSVKFSDEDTRYRAIVDSSELTLMDDVVARSSDAPRKVKKQNRQDITRQQLCRGKATSQRPPLSRALRVRSRDAYD